MNIFYESEKQKFLDEIESRHCIKVLRKKVGDEIVVVDGMGNWHECKITIANPKRCKFEIVATKSDGQNRDYHLHIAIAPTKNIARFEWFLEKATEIGIDEITPILCDHSERKIIKPERLQKVLVSAMKQTLKATLPKLNNSTSFDLFVKSIESEDGLKCFGDLDEKNIYLKIAIKNEKKITVLIGPEGDFSETEFERMRKSNFTSVSLGKSRLRVETAGIMTCAIVNGELG